MEFAAAEAISDWADLFFQIADKRYEHSSTIPTANVSCADWEKTLDGNAAHDQRHARPSVAPRPRHPDPWRQLSTQTGSAERHHGK